MRSLPAAESAATSRTPIGRPAEASTAPTAKSSSSRTHVLPRNGAARDAHAVGRRRIRVLDHHDGVGTGRERTAGRHRERGAGPQGGRRGLAHANRPDDLERCGRRLAGEARVGGHHRIPVDGGACEAGKGRGRQHVGRRHAPEHVVDRDRLDRGSPGRAEGVESLLHPPHAGRLGHGLAV